MINEIQPSTYTLSTGKAVEFYWATPDKIKTVTGKYSLTEEEKDEFIEYIFNNEK